MTPPPGEQPGTSPSRSSPPPLSHTAIVPPITREQVRRFEVLTSRCVESLMRATELVPDHGQGYAFLGPLPVPDSAGGGEVRATLSTNRYARWATAATGCTRADEAALDAVIDFFRSRGVPPCVRIVPDAFTPEQADRLARRGLRHAGFGAVMWAPLRCESDHGQAAEIASRTFIGRAPTGGSIAQLADATLPPGVEIRRVTHADEYDVALETQIAGWGIPYSPDSPMKRNRRPWRTAPGHHVYLTYCDGEPAAHAMLFVDGTIGYLENASTIDRFRRRGLHAALIRRRIADAANEFRCDTIVGAADFESPSRSNQMRCGLALGYMVAFWTGTDGAAENAAAPGARDGTT